MSQIPEHKRHKKRLENGQQKKRSQQCRKDALNYEVGCQQKTAELVYGFTILDICHVLKSSKVLFLHLVESISVKSL